MQAYDERRILLIDHPVGKRDDRASKRLRELGYETQWCCPGEGDVLPSDFDSYRAAVVYGGPESVNDLGKYPYLSLEIDWIERWVSGGRAFLGICLGAQMLARALDAKVFRHPDGLHEIGYVEIEPTSRANGFLDAPKHVYHWHNEGFEVPDGADLLATGPTFRNQAFRYGEKAFGLQFHPEVTPAVMNRWMGEATQSLAAPGAHPPERQRRDSELHDRGMAEWLEKFFDDWLS